MGFNPSSRSHFFGTILSIACFLGCHSQIADFGMSRDLMDENYYMHVTWRTDPSQMDCT